MPENWPILAPTLNRALKRFYAIPPEAEVQLMNTAESQTFAVSVYDQKIAVARVYRSDRHSVHRIHAELEWIEALVKTGFPTASVIRSKDGMLTVPIDGPDGVIRQCAVFEYLEADSKKQPDSKDLVRELGATAARLQKHAKSYKPAEQIDRPMWDFDATFGPQSPWGRWRVADINSDELEFLEQTRQRVELELPPFDSDHTQLLHADLKPNNCIVYHGRVHIIDFDDCGFGWPMFDLAATLTGFENSPELSGLVECWLDGYSTLSRVNAKDIRQIPALVMQRRLMILGWLFANPKAMPELPRDAVVADTVEVAQRFRDKSLLGELVH